VWRWLRSTKTNQRSASARLDAAAAELTKEGASLTTPEQDDDDSHLK